MKKVFKYELEIKDIQTIKSFGSFEPLCIQMQNDRPVLYALVDDESVIKKYRFVTYGTGHDVNPFVTKENYIGTYMICRGELVFHVFKE